MKFRAVAWCACSFSALLSLTACGNETAPSSSTPQPAAVDVYAAGFETVGNFLKPVYWKNDVATVLDTRQYGGRAFGIAVANGNVYVAGFEGSANGNDVAVLWTNGIATQLTDGTNSAVSTGVIVSGTDVYVTGYANFTDPATEAYAGTAEYWKNGSPVVLTTSDQGAQAQAITSDGTNLYVAGYVGTTTQTAPNTYTNEPVVTYWRNGAATALTSGLYYTQAMGIAVANGDVYVSGSLCTVFAPDCSVAAYWKNGTAVPLTQSEPSIATGIAVSGENVYVSVTQTVPGALSSVNVAQLFTNGTLTALSASGESDATCVVTSGGDVYVGGDEQNNAAYWKNGLLNYLGGVTGPSGVYALAVVPQS